MHAPPPPNLGSPAFLAIKSGLAAALALGCCQILHNDDRVSASFVAVLCVSPTVLIGIRRAGSQLLGSVIGGVFGTAFMAVGAPPLIGIPIAVAAAVYTAFRASLPSAYVVAAFTALFVQIVPRGAPVQTFGVRMTAVSIAATAAFLVNVVVSGSSYPSLFDKRVRKVEAYLATLFASAPPPDAYQPAFALIADLRAELAPAIEELGWRRSPDRAAVKALGARVEALARLAHLAVDFTLCADDHAVPHAEFAAFLAWAGRGDGPAPSVPAALEGAAARIRDVRTRL